MLINEEALELDAIEQFKDHGYFHFLGNDISPEGIQPERNEFSEVLLLSRLEQVLIRLNPDIPHSTFGEVLRKIQRVESPDLILNNRSFHKMLVEGVPVQYRHEGRIKHDLVQLVDFNHPENNDFLVVNQFTIIENNRNRRPDIILFINGLPLVVIELKNPLDEDADLKKAFNQLQTYKEDIPLLFVYNELLVISDGSHAKLGSLSANWERFMPWRTIEGELEADPSLPQLEVLIRGILNPSQLLQYIQHFITFESDNETIIKKSAAYHQFHAVNKAVSGTLRATGLQGDQKIGVVWHTQGSGKSLTMLFYTGKIIQLLNNPTILVITDRNDLDGQLFNTFSLSRDLLRQDPVQAQNRQHIKELLTTTAGGVIFSTIQKFLPEKGEAYGLLSDRRNIVVIADEAHRSQYSFSRVVRIRDKDLLNDQKKPDEGVFLREGFAAHIRNALPNASFIGFTGTPIELIDRNTYNVFGHSISIYDISRAIQDRTTVPIYYESRLAKLNLNEPILPEIDEEFEELTEEEELVSRERLKSRWARIAELIGDPKRLDELANDIIDHFGKRLDVIDGKAMIVCMTRNICAQLYQKIVEKKPEWHSEDDDKGVIKVVISGSASDDELLRPHIRSKRRKETIKARVVDDKDPLKFVIVRDMWLTGFDAPCLHTMYVDKPMKGHTLMQAIARVNRVYKDKPGGLIVDYIGIGYYLKQATAFYSREDQSNTGIDFEEVVLLMKTNLEIMEDLFYGFNFDERFQEFMNTTPMRRLFILREAINFILDLEDDRKKAKKRYLDIFAMLNQAFVLAGSHPDALAIRDKIAFFQAIRIAIIKLERTETEYKQKRDLDHAIRQLVSKAIISEDVIDIFALAGLEKPEISIFSEQFLREVKNLPQKNYAVEMLQKLLNEQVKSRQRKNLVQSKAFSQKLKESVTRYQNRTIEASAILEELIELAQEMKKAQDRGDDLGLNDDEVAFYDALTTNQSAVEIMGDEQLKFLARELIMVVRQSANIDFTVRKNVQAKMRVMVKRLLKKYGYPPDLQKDAVKLVMDQAMLFGEEWALISS